MAKICQKKVRIPHFLVGQRPTTDLFHVLACVHVRCTVTGSMGVWAEGPHASPPQGLGFFYQKNFKTLKYIHI